jgi:hypothetical protein
MNTSVYLSSLQLVWLLKMMGIVMMVDCGGDVVKTKPTCLNIA